MNILFIEPKTDHGAMFYTATLNGEKIPFIKSVEVITEKGSFPKVIITCIVASNPTDQVIVKGLNDNT